MKVAKLIELLEPEVSENCQVRIHDRFPDAFPTKIECTETAVHLCTVEDDPSVLSTIIPLRKLLDRLHISDPESVVYLDGHEVLFALRVAIDPTITWIETE